MSTPRVRTNQPGPHPGLASVVDKHLTRAWQRPIAGHSQAAFELVADWLADQDQALVIDSCCGAGDSTRLLAVENPDSLVVGVDKSLARLVRERAALPENALLVRADVNDFWRLVGSSTWSVSRHCLFYPNPYPKRSQLVRRWYASPAFAALLAMGGRLVVRSNWLVYIEEFSLALDYVGVQSTVEQIRVATPVSAFERKYVESGHTLWQLEADLTSFQSGMSS